jgi:hypothetical protein
MSAQLQLIAPQAETAAQRAKRLMAEARQAAEEQVQAMEASLADIIAMAAEIAEGGEAYPVGVRELARRLVEETQGRLQTLAAIQFHQKR